jgi:hypothetical protein
MLLAKHEGIEFGQLYAMIPVGKFGEGNYLDFAGLVDP